MASYFWTSHITSGNNDSVHVDEDATEVIVTAVAGDVYVADDSTAHPPALDAMSTSDHWDGAIVMEGNELRFTVHDAASEFPNTSGSLYFGPVTPSSGACTVSVVLARRP